MARARTILQSEFPYNITGRCINREWFSLPMSMVWEIFCDELNKATEDHGLVIHSFLLMSNHFHLIALTPKQNLSKCMHQFMGGTSRRLTKEGNRINQTFAGRYYKCILQHPNYYLNAYKYNYRNPVAAGICKLVEEYPYSTLTGILNPAKARILAVKDKMLLKNSVRTLKWLNTAPESAKTEAVRVALKHQFFTSKKNRISNRPVLSDNDIL